MVGTHQKFQERHGNREFKANLGYMPKKINLIKKKTKEIKAFKYAIRDSTLGLYILE